MFRTILLFAAALSGLIAQQLANIEGEVVDSAGNGVSNMTAVLCLNGVCGEQVQIHSGRFRFLLGVARGNYTVQVHSIVGEMLVSQPVFVDINQPPVRLILPESAIVIVKGNAGSQISIRRLSHHPPKAAAKELERALESFRKNDPQVGAVHLEKALAADPAFPDAHYLLGLMLEANGANEKALSHLEDAAPEFPKAHIYAAKILSRTGHEAEAKSHLRKYLLTGDTAYREKVVSFLRPAK